MENNNSSDLKYLENLYTTTWKYFLPVGTKMAAFSSMLHRLTNLPLTQKILKKNYKI